MKPKQPKVLSVLALTMISVAAIVNLRNLPVLASQGFSTVFFCVLAIIVFLIPTALVCAELASSWPQAGGVYLWTQKAFGPKIGLFTIWSEWFNNVISFPTTISFIAAAIIYIFIPQIAQHKVIMLNLMLAIIWGCTLFNFLGVKASSRLNIVGAIAGSLIPGAIIIILGFVWWFSGRPIHIDISLKGLLPSFHIKDWVFFLGVLNGYAGMQVTAFHATNVKHPRTDFPKAIGLAALLIMLITIFVALAIAIVVPKSQLSLVSGLMQGFSGFLAAFHLNWALPILAFLIVISGISSLSAWILAPARGLAVAAQQGYFPKWCGYESKRGIPTHILLLQAVLATGLSLLFLFTNSLSTAFWLLIVLTAQFSLVMYVLVFAAAIRLRYTQKEVTNAFQIPGGKPVMWLIAGISMIVCIIGIILGYFPPASLKIHNLFHYETFLIVANIIYIIIPFIIYRIIKI